METVTRANGMPKAEGKAKELPMTQMGIRTKAISKPIRQKEGELCITGMAPLMKVIGKPISKKEEEFCITRPAALMKVIGKTVSPTEGASPSLLLRLT
jgi:hypothetical protein